MANAREIKNRISSVQDTRKITNAMYLISSTKLRKAKLELEDTRPYFKALQAEVKRIFRTAPDLNSRYFYPPEGDPPLDGTYACLVITADKGLAGTYNQNVIKLATDMLEQHDDMKLFVVGEYGRHYFHDRGIEMEESFLYPAQVPTLLHAREIATMLLERYDNREFEKIYIIYTDYISGLLSRPVSTRLLPFHQASFEAFGASEEPAGFEFIPSIEAVLNNVLFSYIAGYIYSALVDSFCSEQSARMTAMDAASQNADKMLQSLSGEYNRVRQVAITQEITEVASGAKAQLKKREREAQGL